MKHWTPTERESLRDLWPLHPVPRLATIFGVPQRDVWAQAVRMGLTGPAPAAEPTQPPPQPQVAPMPAAPAAPPAVRVTQCPGLTRDPRYQLDPAAVVDGGFAAAGIGRYVDGPASCAARAAG